LEDRHKNEGSQLSLKDIYDYVNASLFYAKCKLLASDTDGVEHLLNSCLVKLKEIKDRVIDIKKQMAVQRRDREENKLPLNDG